jgi:prepilin-type N-terminal cleavage/methylation domain-containing protein
MLIEKETKKNKKEHILQKNGFTLVETLIALFLFSLVMVMVSGVFGNFLKNYFDVRRIQKNAESVQFAMNLMAKTIRTSNVQLGSDGKSLEVFDYAQGRCLKYSYISSSPGKMQMNYSNDSNPESLSDCTFSSMVGAQDITLADVTSASFDVTPSDGKTAGLVRMSFKVNESDQTMSPLQIQTAVSLRNLQ